MTNNNLKLSVNIGVDMYDAANLIADTLVCALIAVSESDKRDIDRELLQILLEVIRSLNSFQKSLYEELVGGDCKEMQ